jgi:hypothetical protein
VIGSHLYEGDLYGTNEDPSIVYALGSTQPITFLTHPNDLMNRRQASPADNLDPNDTTPRETSRQFISDLDVKILADAYGYSVVLPSTLNTAHAMLDVWTGTLLVQGGARNNTTGVGVNDTINLQRVTDSLGDDIQVSVGYAGSTYTERVPFAQVTNIVIHGNGDNGGVGDSITVNSNVSATKPWQQVQYVVSSNEDALETSTSVGGDSITNGIVDLSSIIPGSQTTLRAAIREANAVGAARGICVGRGKYNMTLAGTNGDTQGDFDITGNVTIIGAGAGGTVIDSAALDPDDRIFDVAANGVLKVERTTLQLGQTSTTVGNRDGGAVRVQDDGQLDVTQSAIIGNASMLGGQGGGIYFAGRGRGSIIESVITVNESANDTTGGVYLAAAASQAVAGQVTVARSIIARNQLQSKSDNPDVYAGTHRTFTSDGYYRLGNAATGFAHDVNNDYILGPGRTVDYIVTTVADTYDGTADAVNMSLRDAVRQANITSGTQVIWLPAWKFVLTRRRTTAATQVEMNVSEGDLEIFQSTIIRGIGPTASPATSIAWAPGMSDKVLELIGDYNSNGVVDGADYTQWRNEENWIGSNLPSDGNDDGVVDGLDYDIYRAHEGNTLELTSVLIVLPS